MSPHSLSKKDMTHGLMNNPGAGGAAVNFLGFPANPEQHGGDGCVSHRQKQAGTGKCKKRAVIPKGLPPRIK